MEYLLNEDEIFNIIQKPKINIYTMSGEQINNENGSTSPRTLDKFIKKNYRNTVIVFLDKHYYSINNLLEKWKLTFNNEINVTLMFFNNDYSDDDDDDDDEYDIYNTYFKINDYYNVTIDDTFRNLRINYYNVQNTLYINKENISTTWRKIGDTYIVPITEIYSDNELDDNSDCYDYTDY